jgi:hypothetical protein
MYDDKIILYVKIIMYDDNDKEEAKEEEDPIGKDLVLTVRVESSAMTLIKPIRETVKDSRSACAQETSSVA